MLYRNPKKKKKNKKRNKPKQIYEYNAREEGGHPLKRWRLRSFSRKRRTERGKRMRKERGEEKKPLWIKPVKGEGRERGGFRDDETFSASPDNFCCSGSPPPILRTCAYIGRIHLKTAKLSVGDEDRIPLRISLLLVSPTRSFRLFLFSLIKLIPIYNSKEFRVRQFGKEGRIARKIDGGAKIFEIKSTNWTRLVNICAAFSHHTTFFFLHNSFNHIISQCDKFFSQP